MYGGIYLSLEIEKQLIIQAGKVCISNDNHSILSLALLAEQLTYLKSVEDKITKERVKELRGTVNRVIVCPSKYVSFNLHDLVRLVPMDRKTEVYIEEDMKSIKLNANWLRTDLINAKRTLVRIVAECANVLDLETVFTPREVTVT